MSQAAIRAALETALASAYTMATAYQNVDFTPPDSATPYQSVAVLFAEPGNPEMGAGFQEIGYMQVTLYSSEGAGTGTVQSTVETLRSTFRRGATFVSGTSRVTIERTPEASPGYNEDGRFVVPVKIRFFSNFF